MQGFDIDIVKNWVNIREDLLPQVGFVEPGPQASLSSGSFVYTVPPHFTFQDSLRRLQKYTDRGFMLKRVEFREEQTTETEKTQWMDGFRAHVAHVAAAQILRECLDHQHGSERERLHLLEAFTSNEDVGRLIQSFIA